ncbi:cytochrome P450 4C1 [Halyomorpha halys]|uniref:cytochrome P450 4C1 n=1 Tax=Halyomorpha halys TaxID=286706 RepID=UPI0006D4C756|nr:cytochrome P450 4C1 [Halyomorpha halys]
MLPILIALVLCFMAWWALRPNQRLKEAGDKIPGPPTSPIVGNIFNFKVSGPTFVSNLLESQEKYGSVYRVWLGPTLHIFISDPEDVQMLLTSNTLITKSIAYKNLRSWLGTGLLISTGDLWFKRRKAITPTFHFKILEDFVTVFNRCADILVKCLEEQVGKDAFNITDYLSNCALDTVTESAMGTRINAQTDPKNEYVQSILDMSHVTTKKINNPIYQVEPAYTLTGIKKEERGLLKILDSLPDQVIQKKKETAKNGITKKASEEIEGVKKRTAFLELLLKMLQENHPAFQSEQDVKDEVTTFMFEGHDTTTASLSFTMWFLGRHPEIQEKVYEEVSSIIGEEELRQEDINKMKYLDRVVKESLRIFPSVPAIGRTVTHDTVLPSNGMLIPAGSNLVAQIVVTHRRADLFPDPMKFDPDRFLPENAKGRHPYSYVPFSAGPRNCIGQKFAMLDMKAIISKVILNYKIVAEEKLDLNSALIIRSDNSPMVTITKRVR